MGDIMGWLTGWSYRKRHTLVGSTDGAQTNYQVRIDVHRTTGSDSGQEVYVDTKCETDYGDIRFTKADGETLLDYWLQEYVGTEAIFWVEVDTIPVNPDTKDIYVYYGKVSATTTSSGANTFLFFSDGTSFDGWTEDNGGDGDVAISDNTFQFTGSTGNSNRENLVSTSVLGVTSTVLHGKFKCPTGSVMYQLIMGLSPESSSTAIYLPDDDYHVWRYIQTFYLNRHQQHLGGVIDFEVDVSNFAIDVWHKLELKSKSGKQILIIDGNIEDTQTSARSWSDLYVWLGGVSGNSNPHEMYVDDIFARKFADPEPSHSTWYAEQSGILISGITKNTSGSVLVSCEVFLCQDNGDDTASFIAHTISDGATGAYSFEGDYETADYFVIAWKDDTPHVFDATDHVLQGG